MPSELGEIRMPKASSFPKVQRLAAPPRPVSDMPPRRKSSRCKERHIARLLRRQGNADRANIAGRNIASA